MPAFEGRLKLPRPLSSEPAAGPQAFLELTQRLARWEAGGTAAERDAFYGVPTTSAERAELEGAQWFNTSTDSVERYINSVWRALSPTALAGVVDLHSNDMGWTNLSVANGSGWSAGTNETTEGWNRPQGSREGFDVTMRGAFFGGTAGTTASVLPEWMRPKVPTQAFMMTSAPAPSFATIFPNGAFQPGSTSMSGRSQVKWSVR